MTAILTASAIAPAHAVLLSDSFEVPSGAATTGDDALDLTDTAWVGADATTQPVSSVVNDAGLGSYALQVAQGAAGRPVSGSLLETGSLAIGQSITLSANLRFDNVTGGGLRYGIFDASGAGYWANIGTPGGTSAGSSSIQKTDNASAEVFSSFTTLGSSEATGFQGSTSAIQAISFVLERTAADELLITTSWSTSNNGAITEFSRTDTGVSSFDFTSVAFAHGADGQSGARTFLLDDISVVIPEPSTYALLLGALGMLLVVRRRAAK